MLAHPGNVRLRRGRGYGMAKFTPSQEGVLGGHRRKRKGKIRQGEGRIM